MGKINFKMMESESIFLDPQKEFQPTSKKFQVRFDPLTGRSSHFSHFGAIKAPIMDLSGYSTPEAIGFCPFCTDNKYQVTPKFLADIIPEGRMERGEALLVPNLFPYEVYSAVTIMTDDHLVPLEDFTEKRLTDALSVGTDFLKRLKSKVPSIPFHMMTWNYMPPSGGGLVHPHQQYFATDLPGNQFIDEFKAAEKFYQNHQTNYWSELIKEEQTKGERYIGQVGTSHWLTNYISHGILGEIAGIFPNVFNINDFNEARIEELVTALNNIFSYFKEDDIFSFNASLFFGPEGQNFFPAHFRIVPRTFLNNRDFAPDMNFFQVLLQEPICVVLPEDLCQKVKSHF